MGEHTPGPWEVSHGRSIIRQKPYGNDRGGMSGGLLVAQLWTAPSEADAHLIAAAPDMLSLLRWLDRKGGLGLDVHERISAAISKAEGQP